MTKYWKNNGFYDTPSEGAVEITGDEYSRLMVGNSKGLDIKANEEGKPCLATSDSEEFEGDVETYDPTQTTEYLLFLERQQKEDELAECQAQLDDEDYKITKAYEYSLVGKTAEYDMQELHTQREALRARINDLRTQLIEE